MASPPDYDYSAVLSFWFDGDQRENYRLKWFPSRGARQHEMDAQIFGKFGILLEMAQAGHLDSWKDRRDSALALIIVLDQFSRHIFRYQGLPSDAKDRNRADSSALSAAEQLVKLTENIDLSELSIPTAEFVFGLMPFRHSATSENLKSVLQAVDTFIQVNKLNDRSVELLPAEKQWDWELISRFRKQTLRRFQHLQDRKGAAEATSILAHEYAEVEMAEEEAMLQHPLVASASSFLKQFSPDGATVAISLSGGVDSMVLAKILQLICVDANPLNTEIPKVVALHIDYANREESAAEADYVQWYCQKIGVTFVKRVIDEVTRGVTDRTEYEKVSREIRYSFYREVLAKYQCHGIIFGHHQGDVQENVVSNIMRGSSCLDLSGMEVVGVTSGVHVWRPLLNHTKDEIYDFAHRYGVPYFRDTTPSWSTRGKLRNDLIPLLVDMYGMGCLRNLSLLASESDACRSLVEDTIYHPLLRAVRYERCGLYVNISPFINYNRFFWREILKRLMHSLGQAMVRDKAVVSFVERIQVQPKGGKSNRKVSGWLELRKNFAVELSEQLELTIFKEDVFLQSLPEGVRISLSEIHPEMVLEYNPWQIHLSWHDNKCGTPEVSSNRILQSAKDLLSGQFQYSLVIPPSCFTLEFLGARKGGRKTGAGKPPPALTGIDSRVRSGIPFLVPHLENVSELVSKQDTGVYHAGEKEERLLRCEYIYKPEKGC